MQSPPTHYTAKEKAARAYAAQLEKETAARELREAGGFTSVRITKATAALLKGAIDAEQQRRRDERSKAYDVSVWWNWGTDKPRRSRLDVTADMILHALLARPAAGDAGESHTTARSRSRMRGSSSTPHTTRSSARPGRRRVAAARAKAPRAKGGRRA